MKVVTTVKKGWAAQSNSIHPQMPRFVTGCPVSREEEAIRHLFDRSGLENLPGCDTGQEYLLSDVSCLHYIGKQAGSHRQAGKVGFATVTQRA